ncbi:hypothetical protein MUK60_04485 [Streptomyces sp. LRE541]|uniref:hypothetical protein n=1 Tax=Streptomyces sp. LRE541 TaxID=2931983 RepID=UPI002010925A|nr:hypothetical protein [Streptomyces sp. LRE541]UPZ27131.1 hypothetical protein MUK60_04485 [Streptomyces sp. LRE541]
MERVNTLLGKHIWLQFALGILVGSALMVLLFPGRSIISVVIRMTVVSIGSIAVVLAARRKEKRAAGSTDSLIVLDRKLRKGDVPTEPAERDAMRALVAQRLHRTRHRVPALVFLTVLFCSVTVLSAMTGGLRPTIGLALLSVLFIGWLTVSGSKNQRRLRAMDAALKSEGATRSPDYSKV